MARTKGPLSADHSGCLTARMFAGDEVVLDVSFAVARARLAQLTGNDLLRASEHAYGGGIEGLARVGALGLTKVVRVQVFELTETDGSCGLAIRWEATGPSGGLFPTLDADIRLLPTGEQTTLLVLSGVYRPPLGSLGAALDRAALHRVASATIRNFLGRLAAHITGQAEADTRPSAVPFTPEKF